MPDAYLIWNGDLAVSPTGDLALTEGSTLGQQRVLRRLMTNAGDYVWQTDYGAGLGQFVGATTNISSIQADIRSQLFREPAVANAPAPAIDIGTPGDGSIYVHLRYVDAAVGGTQVLSFSVSG